VMANLAMQTLVVGADQDSLQDHVRFVMHRHPAIDERLDLPSGLRVRLRGSTISVGCDLAGMVGVVSLPEEAYGNRRVTVPRQRVTTAVITSGTVENSQRLVWSSCPAWRAA